MNGPQNSAYANLPKIRFIAQPENFGSRIVGEIYQQTTPFHWESHDWNCDGEVYEQKVAKFEKITNENPHSSGFLCLSEHDFRDLKDLKCIEYVKETRIGDRLADRIENARHRTENGVSKITSDLER